MTSIVELINRKKAGGEMSEVELSWLIDGFSRGELPDYQVAAWLMAVCWQGMTERETAGLTDALVSTGETLGWSEDRPVVDKHSTGGVGDKTSIALVPLVASAGLIFVKMSGRGLGHTGGTLDKLESIPGFKVDLGLSALRQQVSRIGCALVGQNRELVPGDAALYALRDVTGTVDSTPLVASSIMAKKLAAGARAIVLDVKYGSGAFMRDLSSAMKLAQSMVAIGDAAGRRIRAVLTPMNEPLGMTVGNALEVREAIDVLRGGGPPEVRDLTIQLGAHLMAMAGAAQSFEDALGALRSLLDSGVAADHFEKLIAAQGGDPGVVAEPNRLPRAPHLHVIHSSNAGFVERVDARGVAEVALMLGAGRRVKGDRIDPRTGVKLRVRVGDSVVVGQELAEVHAATEADGTGAGDQLRKAIGIGDRPSASDNAVPLVIGR